MATARDIVAGALEDKKTIGVGASPTAREMTYGLRRLNEMLFAWRIQGIDLGHVSLAESDAIDLPDDHLSILRLNLARNMPALPGSLDQDNLIIAEVGIAALRGIYFKIATLRCDVPSAEQAPDYT